MPALLHRSAALLLLMRSVRIIAAWGTRGDARPGNGTFFKGANPTVNEK